MMQHLSFIIFSLFVLKKSESSSKNGDFSESHLSMTISCPKEDSVVITGDALKLSDFVTNNGDISNSCSLKTELRVIKVFALRTLFIDKDLNVTGLSLNVFFIAPKWAIIGDRRIAVDGTTGKYKERANSGSSSNTTGADGEPGDPGGPGGNFLGIGETFVDGHRLVITTNGGTGGTGQDGGNGYDQQIARYVDVSALGNVTCRQYYDICRGKDRKYQLQLLDNYFHRSDFVCQGLYETGDKTRCAYKIFGWEGEDGGNGGHGGEGGIGGLPGSVILVTINNESHKISTYGIPGKRGVDGKGGIGGKSGQDGHNVICTIDTSTSTSKIELEKGQKTLYRLGLNGSTGFNAVGCAENPDDPELLETSEIENMVTEHKTWLREIRGLLMKEETLVMFYRRLYDNSNLSSLHNVSYLLKGMNDINKQYFKLKTDVKIIPFHYSALGRVFGFAEDGKPRFLSHTELMTMVYNFQWISDTYLDIGISKLLETKHTIVRGIRQMICQNNSTGIVIDRFSMLNDSKDNPIKELIIESRKYLKSNLAIKFNMSVNYVRKITNMFLKTQVKAQLNKKRYKSLKWKEELNRILMTNTYLTSIALLKDFFSILSVFAEIVSSVVKIEDKFLELLAIVKNNVTRSEVLPDLFQKLNLSIAAFKTKEVTRLKELLKNILEKTRSNPKTLSDVTEELLTVELKLQSNNRLYVANALKSDILNVLQIKKEGLLGVNKYKNRYSETKNSHQAYSLLKRIIQIVTLSRGFIDLYNEYSHNDVNIIHIVKCIEKPDTVLKFAILYENKIFGLIYPPVQYIDDMMSDTLGNPDRLSDLVFAYTKQDLQFSLYKIEQSVGKLIERFQRNYHVIGMLKGLSETCIAYISVFDKLQSYLQLRKLENLIVNPSALVKTSTVFTDVLLSKDFEFFTRHLCSNLILMHYKTAVISLKNHVFPIAESYLEGLILPEHLNPYESFENVFSTVSTQISEISKKVEDYKILVLTGDGIMSRKDFGSRSGHSSEPFFVWGHDQHKDAISKLLSGEKVVLSADISKSNLSESAIKLNSLDFYFKVKNEKIQKKIDDVLKTFSINAKHSGKSQYRYKDHIYVTKSGSLKLSYVYERNEHGNPVMIGGAYDKIRNADVMISPYTVWEIHLINLGPSLGGNYSFKDFAVFKDVVDLELGGNAYYMSKEKVESSNQSVTKYYKAIGKL